MTSLPALLSGIDFKSIALNPIVPVVPKSSDVWTWLNAFIDVGTRRLVDLGRRAPERAKRISTAIASARAVPHALMVSPAVLEIIARRTHT